MIAAVLVAVGMHDQLASTTPLSRQGNPFPAAGEPVGYGDEDVRSVPAHTTTWSDADDADEDDCEEMIDFEAIEFTRLRFFSYHAKYRANTTVSYFASFGSLSTCTGSRSLART